MANVLGLFWLAAGEAVRSLFSRKAKQRHLRSGSRWTVGLHNLEIVVDGHPRIVALMRAAT